VERLGQVEEEVGEDVRAKIIQNRRNDLAKARRPSELLTQLVGELNHLRPKVGCRGLGWSVRRARADSTLPPSPNRC
jgi:hypothetical protein